LTKAPDISLSLLQFVGEIFERSLTLVVDRQELVCERSIGIFSDHSQGPCAAMRTRLPIKNGSLFDTILAQRSTYFGPAKDALLSETLYPHIGAPRDSQILLLPLKSRGRVVTLTYADFGNSQSRHVPLDFIDFFASQAGIPVLCADLPEMRRVVEENGIGMVLEERTAQALAQRVEELYHASREGSYAKSLETAARTLNWENESGIYLDVVERLTMNN